MANSPSPKKRKVGYTDYKDVMAEIDRIAKAEGRTTAEVLREATLLKANEHRKATGKPLLKSDAERQEGSR